MVFLGLLGVVCGASEGVARWLVPASETTFSPSLAFLVDDPVWLWQVAPNLVSTEGRGKVLRTNSLGLRHRETPWQPESGSIRVLVLGESAVWGLGVNAAETFSDRLEGLLTQSAGRPVEVINAGQPAWSIWQSAAWFADVGRRLNPDIVVVYHLQNDFLPRGPAGDRDPLPGSLTDRQMSALRRPIAPFLRLVQGSRLRFVLWSKVFEPRLTRTTAGVGTTNVTRVPAEDRSEALAWLARSAADVHARLVITRPTYANFARIDDPLLATFAKQEGLVYVDLHAARVADPSAPSPFFQVDDCHPTAAGHRFLAATLRTALAPLVADVRRESVSEAPRRLP